MGEKLDAAHKVAAWADGVKKDALAAARDGEVPEGYCLVSRTVDGDKKTTYLRKKKRKKMPSIAFGEDKSAAPMEPLADGKHNFEILEANFGQTQGGTEFMEVTLREVEGGRRVWQSYSLQLKPGGSSRAY